jgi:hypothetical protein
MKLLLTLILFSSFLYSDTTSKKELLLSITKRYLPDNYIVIKNYDETTINFLAQGDSLQDFIFEFPTIIHEGFHVFEHSINSYSDTIRHYRLDDTTTIAVRKFISFPSKKLNGFVPTSTQKKIFRYDTYINSEDTLNGTQQDGFLGLLEEYSAYYQSLKAYTATYFFLRDTFGWTKPQIWIDYLNKSGSEIYSINEFKLFFSWYLQYSKLKRPDIYKKIISDAGIKRLYTKIDINSRQLINTFLKNRKLILTNLKPYSVMEHGSIKVKGTDISYQIDDHIEMLIMTQQMLNDPKNRILNVLQQ